ncbi:bacteriocin immunity protein [Aerococcaceae bacterium NML201209]|nr:bacteriocin immunity protein [Aerococcaceae bacterium NML201209]MCW6666120.1 bacteriocin immunity protein [Aerococcaceae bacterium NML190938]
MMKAQELVHRLYNSVSIHSRRGDSEDLLEVLLKVHQRLPKEENEVALLNRLVHYIYFCSVNDGLKFNAEQNALIRELAELGKHAGVNGCYRSDYGDKSQF